MSAPEPEWKGWALGDTALFLEQPPGQGRIWLCLQYRNDVRRLAQFLDEHAAMETQIWLDAAITSVGLANQELCTFIQDALHG